jgi:prepilin-type N-terminal cleavage/methylation domain-containing protein
MKLSQSSDGAHLDRRAAGGFTLPEMLIATTIFAFLVLGIVGANIFGLKFYQIGQTKMLATDSAREAIGKMSDELRCCNNAMVGNISNGAFVAHVAGEQLTGDGLMIYATTNTNDYVLYFVNAANQTFTRFATDLGTNSIIAQSVTNANIFQAQDYQGNVLTNNQSGGVIHCSVQFYAAPPQSPVPGYYQVQTAVAPRSQN